MTASMRRSLFLHDTPAGTDLFGSHERIAEAIDELVRVDPHAQAIALRGRWGSGKSTVVKLLGRRIEADSARAIVTFDAWAHDGDNLRRAVLLSLGRSLVANAGWLDPEVWDVLEKDLSGRTKVSEVRNRPQFTEAGKQLAVALFVAPLGLAITSAALRDAKSIVWSLLVVGLFFALAPLFVALGHIATQGDRAENGKPVLSDDLLSLFLSRSATVTETKSFETREPSSIEFAEKFEEILEAALGKSDRKLVLVVDNLDRVSPSRAIAIWSTLQAYLGSSEQSKRPWRKRLWLIIAFDPVVLESKLEGAGAGTRSPDEETETIRGLLEKHVQISFDVPPLPPTLWNHQLEKDLKTAFPEHDEASFVAVRAAVREIAKERAAPTPREVRVLVNRLVSQYRIWGESVPLAHGACYAQLEQRGIDIGDGLRGNTLPIRDLQRVVGGDVMRSLTQLHLGVQREEAVPAFFREQIIDAINRGALSELYTRHGQTSGFMTALELATDDLCGGVFSSDRDFLYRGAGAVVELRAQAAELAAMKAMRSRIYGLAAEAGSEGTWRRGMEAILAGAISDRAQGATIAGIWIGATSVLVSAGARDVPVEQEMVDACAVAARMARDCAPPIELPPLVIDGNLQGVGRVVEAVQSAADAIGAQRLQELLMVSGGEEQRIAEINAVVADGRANEFIRLGVEHVRRIVGWNLQGLVRATWQTRIDANGAPQLSEVYALTGLLLDDWKSSDGGLLQTISTSGHLASHFYRALEAKEWPVVGRALLAHLLGGGSWGVQSSLGYAADAASKLREWQSGVPETVLGELVNQARRFSVLDRLLKVSEAFPDSILSGLVVAALERAPEVAEVATEVMVEVWDRIGDHSDVGAVCDEANMWPKLRDATIKSGEEKRKWRLVRRLIERAPKDETLLDVARQALGSVDVDGWAADLEQGAPMVRFAVEIRATNWSLGSAAALRLAAQNLTVRVIRGDSVTAPSVVLSDVASALPAEELESLGRDVLKELRANGQVLASIWLDQIGELLVSAGTLRRESVWVRDWCEQLVERSSEAELQWLETYLARREMQAVLGADGYREKLGRLVTVVRESAPGLSEICLRIEAVLRTDGASHE